MEILARDPAKITARDVERIEAHQLVEAERQAFAAAEKLGWGAATRALEARATFRARLGRVVQFEDPAIVRHVEAARFHLDSARVHVQAVRYFRALTACVPFATAERVDWSRVAEPAIPPEIGRSAALVYITADPHRFDVGAWFSARRDRLTDPGSVRVTGRKLAVRAGVFSAEEAAVLHDHESQLADLIGPAQRPFVAVRPWVVDAVAGAPATAGVLRAELIAAIVGAPARSTPAKAA